MTWESKLMDGDQIVKNKNATLKRAEYERHEEWLRKHGDLYAP